MNVKQPDLQQPEEKRINGRGKLLVDGTRTATVTKIFRPCRLQKLFLQPASALKRLPPLYLSYCGFVSNTCRFN